MVASNVSSGEAESLPNRTALPIMSTRKTYLVSGPWIPEERTTIVPNKESDRISAFAWGQSTRWDNDFAFAFAKPWAPVVQPLFVDVVSKNVRVQTLQRWTGRIERVCGESFVATVFDVTTPANPAQEVDLDIDDVSASDLSLISEGAVFYWTIAYRVTKGGQRERVSSIRFARQPKLRVDDLRTIYAEADEMTALLESA